MKAEIFIVFGCIWLMSRSNGIKKNALMHALAFGVLALARLAGL